MAYNQIKHSIWTPGFRQNIIYLQEEIKSENNRLHNKMWEKLINKLEVNRKDPKKFWLDIWRLMGGKNNTMPPYIWGANQERITEEYKKMELFVDTWQSIFTISPEDNREFNLNNEIRVNDYLRENSHRMRPYPKANKNRLDNNDPLTKPLSLWEMLQIIKNFKNKAPGESGVNKFILLQLPHNALQRLNDIINLLLSMGYFSIIFKNGHMVLTPKGDKDNCDPINYRPITILEVPAKI